VESSCEFGNEPSGFIKCWETIEYPNLTTRGLSSGAQLHTVSEFLYFVPSSQYIAWTPHNSRFLNIFRLAKPSAGR
jgi:hypothetical protein